MRNHIKEIYYCIRKVETCHFRSKYLRSGDMSTQQNVIVYIPQQYAPKFKILSPCFFMFWSIKPYYLFILILKHYFNPIICHKSPYHCRKQMGGMKKRALLSTPYHLEWKPGTGEYGDGQHMISFKHSHNVNALMFCSHAFEAFLILLPSNYFYHLFSRHSWV